MDKIQINANICKKISANKENTTLERALADKCIDLYRIVAERSTVICQYSTWKHCAEIPESKPKSVTYRELARWLSEGNGEVMWSTTVCSNWNYSNDDENEALDESFTVRKWDDTEWHKPTREYLGLED